MAVEACEGLVPEGAPLRPLRGPPTPSCAPCPNKNRGCIHLPARLTARAPIDLIPKWLHLSFHKLTNESSPARPTLGSPALSHRPSQMLSRSPSPSRSSRSRSPSPPLQLDPNTLALLNNFYSERTQVEEEFAALEAKAQARLDRAKDQADGGEAEERMSVDEFRRLFGEDWQLSQFW